MKKLILFLLYRFVVCRCMRQTKYQSRVMTDTLYSDVLKAKRAYTVYLPKSFEQDKKKNVSCALPVAWYVGKK